MKLYFSFIIPVYDRPEEVKELLDSFSALNFKQQFEIVIVEDGSNISSADVVQTFANELEISYYVKENTGPGDSRNYGMSKAKGNYFIILDSDCILPSHYLTTVHDFLEQQYYHCFGGADAAHESFTNLQKAINYVMTSFLTTGGIRGSEKSISRFEPRSFNMGISKEAFLKTGGFAKIHPGEDPDLSQRMLKAGFKTTFLPNAFVYHKRRISWKKFYTQVRKFGLVRPILNSWHPEASKITFWLPSIFVCFIGFTIIASSLWHPLALLPLSIYLLLIFCDASVKNKSLIIGGLSVFAVFVQFFGYGLAFLQSNFYINFLKRDPKKQFPKLFFK
ncbi:MAG: glycosyltransferase [Altibacter sp.]|uniref:glycosyltransferase n=1 Tax=Altibacter sp. TaxID=2024823 RepID=UPI001DFCD070|nr:glycosyltransferase [Altibacter sp.]MBZ0326463.1 glycosyltransferase [Altibacter sp.]